MSQPLSMDQAFLIKLDAIIRENLQNEKFGVEELSHEMGMSYSKIHRKIKSLTNKSVNRYIREFRLQQALELLQNNVATVSEIAFSVGFSDPAYFSNCFREYYGYPPGEVKKRNQDNGIKSGDNQTSGPENNQRSKGRLILLIALLLCIVCAFGIFRLIDKNRQAHDLAEREKSIAVLPFINDSPDQENTYFINGIMEEIFTDLQKIRDFRIISRTSVEKYRGRTDFTLPQIAKDLDVNYIVEGSGQKLGNKYILRVQLIAAHNERHLWARTFEQEIQNTNDIFKVQNQVAREIASALKATITPEEKELIEKVSTKSLIAHDFYVRGLQEMNKLGTIDDNGAAAKRVEYLYRNALKYDSSFARAYVGLANVYWIKIEKERNIARNDVLNRYLDSMLFLANIAISLDDKLSEAYDVRGGCYYNKGDERQALEDWNKACRYNPNDFSSYWCKGWFYESHDIISSIENYQKAALIDHGPRLSEILTRIGGDYFMAGFPENGYEALAEALKVDGDSLKYFDNCIYYAAENQGAYQKAVEYFGRRFQNDSTNDRILLRLGFYNSLTGRFKESLKYYEKYLSGSYKSITSTSVERRKMEANIGYVYMQNGFSKAANIYFDRAIANYKRFIKSAPEHEIRIYEYRLAGEYACKGDKDKAYENLSLLGNSPCFTLNDVTLIKIDPLFNSIRSEPEFQKIVKDMVVKYEAEHEKVRQWMEGKGRV